jgi:hypothetical protein
LGRLLSESRRQGKQLEQRPEDGDIDLLRSLDVLELLQFVERPFSKQRDLAGVDLVAGDRQDDVTRIASRS